MLIEDDDDAPPTRYVKGCPGQLFKHDLEALKQKTKLTNMGGYAMKRFYRLKECCSDLELDEKSPANVVHHEIRRCY